MTLKGAIPREDTTVRDQTEKNKLNKAEVKEDEWKNRNVLTIGDLNFISQG